MLDTVVTFTLTTTATRTRLDIVQSGFRADQKQNYGGARYGWRMMGTRLVDLLSSTPWIFNAPFAGRTDGSRLRSR